CYDSSSTVSRCSSIFLRRPPPRSTLFPYTTLFRSLPRPDPVDAVSQLKLMIAKLPANSDASDALRSYSLSWMIHLVGDLHQPLHAIARYSAALPDKGGDRGGNEVQVVAANGEKLPLHFYW